MNDTIDPEKKSVSFERILSASPEDVFDAWTQPEELSQWWDPTGTPLVSCSIDLKPKGSFRFVTAGHAPPFEGSYEVIDRPHRLEFVAMGAKGTVRLKPHLQGTLMSVSIQSPTAEHFEMFVKLGVQAGTAQTLDNLVALLGRRRKAASNGRR
jgi:uncharacterized protein YndB with AHSA1/START domain